MVAKHTHQRQPSAEAGPMERKANPPDNTFAASHARKSKKVVRIEQFELARQVLLSDRVKQAGFMAEVAAHFTKRDHLPVLFQEGEAHHKQRAATAHLFSAAVVTVRYRELIKTYSERLIAALRESGSARLDVLALELAVAVTADVVGLTESPASELTRRLSSFFKTPAQDGGRLTKLKHFFATSFYMLRFFARDVRPAILTRRAKRQDDLISHLIDRNYSARDILTEAITYGAAGIATTRELIVMAAWHLFENATLRQRFLSATDKERLAIVEEILRLEPVVGVLYRDVEKDIHLNRGGEAEIISAGTRIAVDVRAVNTDAAVAGGCPYHVDADRKKALNATSGSIMSFGEGWHRCPGAALALQEAAVFLECLFSVPGIELERVPTIEWNSLVESYELRDAVVRCDRL